VKVTEHSQPATTKPSDLGEGQFLEVEHAGVFYQFCYNYSALDMVVGKIGEGAEDGTRVTAVRFNSSDHGYPSILTPEIADAIWEDLRSQLDQIQAA